MTDENNLKDQENKAFETESVHDSSLKSADSTLAENDEDEATTDNDSNDETAQSTTSTDENQEELSISEDDQKDLYNSYHITYPELIKKFGVWPVNIGLFFFYNNVVSLVVLILGLLIMHNTGVVDQKIINEKLGGLSVISSLITLGLTLIYSKRFYFTRN